MGALRKSRFVLFVVFLGAASEPVPSTEPSPAESRHPFSRDVTVALASTVPAARIGDHFLSVAVDSAQAFGAPFWSAPQPSLAGDRALAPFDFSRPRLRRLAAELAPAYLRIGGTAADSVYYDLSEEPQTSPPRPFKYLLTRAHWDGITAFARDVGFDIMFTLNTGPSTRDTAGAWTPDNAESLVAYAASRMDPVSVWEMGNEINGYPFIYGLFSWIGHRQYARDFKLAQRMVRTRMPSAKVAGPASAFWPLLGEFNPILSDFLAEAGPLVDIVTWHYYPMQSVRCLVADLRASPQRALDPADLDRIERWAGTVERARDRSAPSAEVWLGETGGAQCGGQPNVSDSFVGSFWWLDELGILALRGESVVVRQSLSGANYGLLDDETLEPRPDYFASVAFKRLAGSPVLATHVDDPENHVRAYAHCTPPRATGYAAGAVTLIVLNLDQQQSATIHLQGASDAGAFTYVFTAPEESSRLVWLNGQPLRATPEGAVPPFEPALLTGEGLALPPLSYAFAVLPNARAAACMP